MKDEESKTANETEKSKAYPTEIHEPGLEDIALYMKEFHPKKIIVISGSRMSAASGVPDLRSPDIGLYHARIAKGCYGCDLFNKNHFLHNPQLLYRLLRFLLMRKYRPTLSHFFIALLQKKKLLLRNYTQNMDNLEKCAGVKKLVQINGSFYNFSCMRCEKKYTRRWTAKRIYERRIPQCTQCAGIIKPDVTFYRDQLPSSFYENVKKDFAKCDLLIILGSTLSNEPLATILRDTPVSCPRLMITEPYPHDFSDFDFYGSEKRKDFLWIGNCIGACKRLAKLLGWHRQLIALAKRKQKIRPKATTRIRYLKK